MGSLGGIWVGCWRRVLVVGSLGGVGCWWWGLWVGVLGRVLERGSLGGVFG